MLALSAALAVCNSLAKREAFLNTFIGKNETEVVRQLGVPARSFETQGRRFLAYDERSADVYPGGPFWGGPFWGGPYYGGVRPFGYGYGAYAFSPYVAEWTCETTFEIVNTRVTSWSLRGNACD